MTGLYLLLAHLTGDYVIQTDWMAQEKTRRWWPAVVHAVTYGLPFLFITRSIPALAVIVGTHLVIDRYRLARHICWVKTLASPSPYRRTWAECRATGFPPDMPVWLSTWLMIIVDNTVHIGINAAAVVWL